MPNGYYSEGIIRRPFSLTFQFDKERVTANSLKEKLATQEVAPSEELASIHGSNWTLITSQEILSLYSPLFTGGDSMQALHDILGALNFGSPSPITRKCSLLLDLEIQDMNLREMLMFAQTCYKIEPAIMRLLPPSRRAHDAAHPLRTIFEESYATDENLPPAALAPLATKRQVSGVFFGNYLHWGTVQIRYGAGTSNFSKVNNWVYLWHSIMNRMIRFGVPEENIESVEALCDWIGWTEDRHEDLRDWHLNRAESLRENRRRNATAGM